MRTCEWRASAPPTRLACEVGTRRRVCIRSCRRKTAELGGVRSVRRSSRLTTAATKGGGLPARAALRGRLRACAQHEHTKWCGRASGARARHLQGWHARLGRGGGCVSVAAVVRRQSWVACAACVAPAVLRRLLRREAGFPHARRSEVGCALARNTNARSGADVRVARKRATYRVRWVYCSCRRKTAEAGGVRGAGRSSRLTTAATPRFAPQCGRASITAFNAAYSVALISR